MTEFILIHVGIVIIIFGVAYFVERKFNRESELLLRFDRDRKTMSNETLQMYYDWLLEIDDDFPYDIMLKLCEEEIRNRKINV